MNYLAHCYLSFDVPGLLVGNYLGDFIRNDQVQALPQTIKDGVLLHRRIDVYTDTHKSVKEGTKLLHESMHKYAPVVLDIFFDYFLSKNWLKYNQISFELFCKRTYLVLEANKAVMPDPIAGRMGHMVAGKWLNNYRSIAGLRKTFDFLQKRAKFPSKLYTAPQILLELETPLDDIFKGFFPELMKYAQQEILDMGYVIEKSVFTLRNGKTR